ncbi:MAG: M20/M25/M40 family metallo-hydrolase [candidate division Zixibacteria bacterium]|nr:M20/M25/M40 family metallo-hydrolase [candidate division Zixibacteria bacterium]
MLDWDTLGREAVTLLSRYVQIDTTNPRGNEKNAAVFMGSLLKHEGIPYQIFESAPGRATLYARLRGDGSRRPVILLSHSDVVQADPQHWSVDPFGGVIKDGYIWGRGTLDMKNLGIAELVAFLAFHRSKFPLERDLILLVTADEETGGSMGAGWFVKNQPELVRDAEFLINESGKGRMENGTVVFAIDITEKTPCWLRLTATGEPGHGSRPKTNSSVNRLLRALNRVMAYEPPVRLTPPVEAYFKGTASLRKGLRRKQFSDIRASLENPEFLAELYQNSQYSALLRNTISITMLQGSSKINIIPQTAIAELDCRLLPGEDPDAFVEEIRHVVDDEGIRIDTLLSFGNTASPFNSPFTDAVRTVVSRYYPGAEVTPNVLSGFTDSHFFRELGIGCYGFMPFLLPDEDLRGIHGNDERISVENMSRGPKILYEVLERLCGK